MKLHTLFAAVLSSILICGTPAEAADPLPEGKGKETVQKMCGGACHELDVVTSERLSKQGWSNVVDTMISRGAMGTDEEISNVVEYLAAHFGSKAAESAAASKINVNTEGSKELATDLELSETAAQAIVDYRVKQGRIKGWDDLARAPGLDIKKIESKKDRVVF